MSDLVSSLVGVGVGGLVGFISSAASFSRGEAVRRRGLARLIHADFQRIINDLKISPHDWAPAVMHPLVYPLLTPIGEHCPEVVVAYQRFEEVYAAYEHAHSPLSSARLNRRSALSMLQYFEERKTKEGDTFNDGGAIAMNTAALAEADTSIARHLPRFVEAKEALLKQATHIRTILTTIVERPIFGAFSDDMDLNLESVGRSPA